MPTLTLTDDDLLTVRTLLAAVREHKGVLMPEDPESYRELVLDGESLLRRMGDALSGRPEPKAIDWTDVPL